MEGNPYQAPRSNINQPTTVADPAEVPTLWNPRVATGLSLLFSTAFGAVVVARNWRTLGDPRRAQISMLWAYSMLVVVVLGFVLPDKLIRPLGIAHLVTWYLTVGWPQVQYVKKKLNDTYVHKGWGKPILIFLGFLLGALALVFTFVFVSELVTGSQS